MPSNDHELPLEMVRNQPSLVPELLRSVYPKDIPRIPNEVEAKLTSETYEAFHPQELRCDATVLVGDPKKPLLGVITESQLKYDPDKNFSWPAYVANFRLRHKCDTFLLVFCPDERVARACARPIRMGHPELILKPLTFHPGLVGPITDPEQARKAPELAILSTPAHVDGPHQVAVLDSYNAAIDQVAQVLGVAIATQYHDHTTPQLSAVARKLMEDLMQAAGYEWKSEFAIHHRAEGKAEGKAEGRTEEAAKLVLRILQKRGVCVSDDARKRITECTDLERLEEWVLDAGTVASVDELFTG